MEYRHEMKHEINAADRIAIRQRLKYVAKIDSHAVNGKYFIRSLYFDTISDKALREKLDGVSVREKFRIRYYNQDTSVIHLEKKSKFGGLGNKQSTPLIVEEVQKIIDGDIDWMLFSDKPLIQELYAKMKSQGLRPKTIVDYVREPFVFGPGNVRVTLDYDIRTGLSSVDFLNPNCPTIPVKESPIILEVKWDHYLPDIIRDAIQLPSAREGAYSKYAACRMYD